MAKKDGVKKVAEKAGMPGKATKTKAAKAKAPAKTQSKGTTLKKPAQAQVKAETVFRVESPQAAEVLKPHLD